MFHTAPCVVGSTAEELSTIVCRWVHRSITFVSKSFFPSDLYATTTLYGCHREAHTGQLFIGTNNFHQGLHPRWSTAGLSHTSVRTCFGNRRITEAIIAVPPM